MVAQLATEASQTLHAYTETNPIVFISHIIAPGCRNNIKLMQPHLAVQPFALQLQNDIAQSYTRTGKMH